MKKRIIIVLGILIAAGGIGTGVWYHFKGNGQSGTGDSIVYVSKVSVITGSETTAVNRFAGVVEPQKTVNVKIESGRKVKEVEVKTGEEVKAGQPGKYSLFFRQELRLSCQEMRWHYVQKRFSFL